MHTCFVLSNGVCLGTAEMGDCAYLFLGCCSLSQVSFDPLLILRLDSRPGCISDTESDTACERKKAHSCALLFFVNNCSTVVHVSLIHRQDDKMFYIVTVESNNKCCEKCDPMKMQLCGGTSRWNIVYMSKKSLHGPLSGTEGGPWMIWKRTVDHKSLKWKMEQRVNALPLEFLIKYWYERLDRVFKCRVQEQVYSLSERATYE